MRILIVNTLYAPFQVGGAEVSVRTMAEGLVKAGQEVYVLTLGYKDSAFRLNGVIIITLKTRNLYHIEKSAEQGKIKKLIWHLLDSYNPFYKSIIAKLLDRIKPDVVNTNNIQGFSPFIWKIIKSRNLKLVHTLRDYYLMCHTTTMYTKCGDCQQLCMPCKLTWKIKKNFFQLPDQFVGISNFILDEHKRYNIGMHVPTKVIANGLPEKAYYEARIKQPGSQIKLGFIGKVNAQKGVDFLFDELSKLPTERPFKLILAGKATGEFKQQMQEKYFGKFEFEFIGKTDPVRFYDSVDLVIVPSNWNEPFGRIPIEAVAANTPVCIAYKAGLKELYNEACMWRFDMVENSLKDLLKSIIADPNLITQKSKACAGTDHKYVPELLNAQLLTFLNE